MLILDMVTLPMHDAIDAVRAGFIALSTGRATVPVRGVMAVDGNTTLTMPAYIHGSAVSIVKVISVYPDNPKRDLPAVLGKVMVLDAQTGRDARADRRGIADRAAHRGGVRSGDRSAGDAGRGTAGGDRRGQTGAHAG